LWLLPGRDRQAWRRQAPRHQCTQLIGREHSEMWISGSADWPAAERQLIVSRLGANRLPVRWASWQRPSLGNRSGKSYAGIQSATSYRPEPILAGGSSGRARQDGLSHAGGKRARAFRPRQLQAGCPAVGSTNTRIMPPLSSMTAGLLREMCFDRGPIFERPTEGPVPRPLVRG
jgi:hypothetical protein